MKVNNQLGSAEHFFNSPSNATPSELALEPNQADQNRPLNVCKTPNEATRDTYEAFVSGDDQRLYDALPGWAGEFCAVMEERMEINGDILAVAMVGSISGFAGGHLTGDAAGTMVPLNLQIMLSTPRSGGKSRAFDATTKPLYVMQEQAVDLAKHEWVELVRPEIILHQKRIKELEKDMDGSESDRPTAEEIAGLEHKVECLNRRPEDKKRYLLDNSTGPARNMMLAEADRNAIFFLTPDARANMVQMLDGNAVQREAAIEQILKGFSGDPLISNRVTERLRREAPHQWLSSLLGIQPDLAEKFWGDPHLRRSGVHSRIQCFHFDPLPNSAMRYPDDDVRRVQAVWRSYLTQLDELKRKHLGGPPIGIGFTQHALDRLNGIDHPFGATGWGGNSLQAALCSRWPEVALRWALVLAVMKFDGGALPEVGAAEIDAACTLLFRAHRDAVGLAGPAARSPDQAALDDLVQYLARNGGQMPLASGNPLGLSIANVERLVLLNPERLRIAPVSNGGRGRPKKHVLLNA